MALTDQLPQRLTADEADVIHGMLHKLIELNNQPSNDIWYLAPDDTDGRWFCARLVDGYGFSCGTPDGAINKAWRNQLSRQPARGLHK